MSVIEMLLSSFEAAMIHLAFATSRFEAETLRIPASLRFFTVGGDAEELFTQALMFTIAPYNAFFVIPLMEALQDFPDPEPRSNRLLRYGRWYLLLLLTFWVIILVVRKV
jgi:hypothetical protein